METKKNKKTENTQVKKEKVSTRKPKVKVESNNSIHSKMVNLEMAYMNAISGKIKFGEVKSMFKKLHKEIKATSKK